MTMAILVAGRQYDFIRFRSFIYNGRKYTIFIEPGKYDEHHIPVCYNFKHVEENIFEVPSAEEQHTLNEFVSSLITDCYLYGHDYIKELSITLLPFGE